MADQDLAIAVQGIMADVAQVMLKKWTCRHCGHQTSGITEFCNGCGVEDCRQGKGEESERDRRLRLAGKRHGVGLWTDEKVLCMVRGLVGHD
jgi:hypothetical protein